MKSVRTCVYVYIYIYIYIYSCHLVEEINEDELADSGNSADTDTDVGDNID